jgi:hypothetical protein
MGSKFIAKQPRIAANSYKSPANSLQNSRKRLQIGSKFIAKQPQIATNSYKSAAN